MREIMLESPPNAIRNLIATVANSKTSEVPEPKTSRMSDTNDRNSNFVIPTGKGFIVTDIIFTPQYLPIKGTYTLQLNSSQGITLNYAATSSFQTSFTTGMVLKSGSTIDASYFHDAFPDGEGSATVKVFGYLFDS
jgi:uncharacterized membrane protein